MTDTTQKKVRKSLVLNSHRRRPGPSPAPLPGAVPEPPSAGRSAKALAAPTPTPSWGHGPRKNHEMWKSQEITLAIEVILSLLFNVMISAAFPDMG
jgi:hypothetical protein